MDAVNVCSYDTWTAADESAAQLALASVLHVEAYQLAIASFGDAEWTVLEFTGVGTIDWRPLHQHHCGRPRDQSRHRRFCPAAVWRADHRGGLGRTGQLDRDDDDVHHGVGRLDNDHHRLKRGELDNDDH